MHIPVGEPRVVDTDVGAVIDAMRSGWISSAGPALEAFERTWADHCEREHGVAVSSGTTALELAVEALDLKPGDEVIIPAFTIISCALAMIRAGATPVLVDCDPGTWCMTPDAVRRAITPRTRAIMPVHVYGHPCDMTPLLALAAEHGLAVVEDAAEAHGAEYLQGDTWRPCGAFGVSSAFSFYANKLITTGEGGMIVTDDDALAERLRSQRNLAFDPARRFRHLALGHQYRFTNMQAALGLSQIGRLPELLVRKRWMGAAYTERFANHPALEIQQIREWARPSYWMFGIVLRDHVLFDAEHLAERLQLRGVETRPFFLGMHEQPALRDIGLFANDRHAVTERLSRRGLYLPSGVALTEIQLERVCDAVDEVLR